MNLIKGVFNMNTNIKNIAIKCTINNCAHHCNFADYCSLDSIVVGTHEANPTVCQCTDCMSFKLRA